MKIAVLSGKGGTGKTFISTNLAAALKNSVYVDCDVEEPNGRIFLQPQDVQTEDVNRLIPEFDSDICSACRKCVDFCRFNALIFIKNKPLVFKEVCHSCGACAYLCPEGAVTETERKVGVIEKGRHGTVDCITGILDIGEASGVPVIKKVLQEGEKLACKKGGDLIVDCPPGSACSVQESVADADYCLMVVEPTAFGLHNFKMVYELVELLGKDCGIVINKEVEVYKPLEDFCREKKIPVLLRIPFSKKIAGESARGILAVEENKEVENIFLALRKKTGGKAS